MLDKVSVLLAGGKLATASSKYCYPGAMSKLAPDSDALYEQVHRRMVESGEWDRCAYESSLLLMTI